MQYQDLSACEIAMTDLLMAETDIEALQAEQALAVAAASVEFERRIDEAKRRRDEVTAALRDFYFAHLDECEREGAKHCKLQTGVMGRRENPPALKPMNRNWTWETIAVRLRELWGAKYFHTPKPPGPDKDALKELGAEELAKAGLKVEREETFYAEPARPEKTS
jgi:phage host-nuclease inhibitor protein Gam